MMILDSGLLFGGGRGEAPGAVQNLAAFKPVAAAEHGFSSLDGTPRNGDEQDRLKDDGKINP